MLKFRCTVNTKPCLCICMATLPFRRLFCVLTAFLLQLTQLQKILWRNIQQYVTKEDFCIFTQSMYLLFTASDLCIIGVYVDIIMAVANLIKVRFHIKKTTKIGIFALAVPRHLSSMYLISVCCVLCFQYV